MIRIALFAMVLIIVALSCHTSDGLLRAKQIDNRGELIGGPVAMADVGDFLLENDQLRVAILRSVDSPGPGVFGGSVVDIDRRRGRIGEQGGHGRDRFAESFPFANLMVPEPESIEVTVHKDGSDGVEAAIRVEGQGEFFFEALGILRSSQDTLAGIGFPRVRTRVRFTTDYILRPGARHIFIRTLLRLPDETPEGCPPLDGCQLSCEHGFAEEPDGCLACACSELLTLDYYRDPVNVFGRLLGDPNDMDQGVMRAGILAGDFVFFGNQNDVWAPGIGFDEEGAVQATFNQGRNTFAEPLVYDFVAAAGGDVSYGYFTYGAVNVPLFESAATTFLAAGKNCLFDTADDGSCDRHRSYLFERFLVVGDGDIASVAEEIYRMRGTPTGELDGVVLWSSTGEPVPNARLFVFDDPDPSRAWTSVDEVAAHHLDVRGHVGMVSAIDADRGLDPVEDGDFKASLPPGRYLLVARAADDTAIGAPIAVEVRAGETTTVIAGLDPPATVRYSVSDDLGRALPAKLSFVSVDGEGQPLPGDAHRRPYLGDTRLASGVREIEYAAHGQGELVMEPGRYDIVVSRGMEYGIHRENAVELASGAVHNIDALLRREIDSEGWMSIDMHLHSTPSFDSGFPIASRVKSAVVEGLEIAVSTDHDVSTDYLPTIRELLLEPHLATAVGAEITTLEQGHFIGFPLAYDALVGPTHGAHDWTCQGAADILAGIRAGGADGIDPLTIVAHPRDGFFGYFDQLGVDGYLMTRNTPSLEAENPAFRVASCDFDAMELINGKRFDLIRTPTVAEVIDFNRCVTRINQAPNLAALALPCPELGPLASCAANERLEVCRTKNRDALAASITRRMLERTPEEQNAEWFWPGDQGDTEDNCDPATLGDDPIPPDLRDLPCNFRPGHLDDFFRLLERGMLKTQLASSDSHNPSIEPGAPRTYVKSDTDDPASVSIEDVVKSLRAGRAFTTHGPFVRASIGDRSFGEVAGAPIGSQVELALDVLSPSWFAVDRVEIYLNGLLYRVLHPAEPKEAIVDVRGKVTITVPARDSWIVIVAMGLGPGNTLHPVSLDVAYGDLQIARIVSDAFSRVPVVNALFPPPLLVPDWSPIVPFAATNPIYLDTDGNGVYNAPLPPPDFCSRPCDPAAPACPFGQQCLEPERLCGDDIEGTCNRRPAQSG